MTGFVYIVNAFCTNIYKIGISKNPISRFKTMQTDCPFIVIKIALFETDNYRLIEKQLHRKYSNKRKIGEWFRFTLEDLDDVIKSAQELCENSEENIKISKIEQSNTKDKFICEKCDRKFTCKRNLQYHKNKKRPCTEQVIIDGKLECKDCGKGFKTHGGLYYHVKNKLCKDIKNIAQEKCDKNIIQNEQIIKDYDLKCENCGREFATHGGLCYHMKHKLCKDIKNVTQEKHNEKILNEPKSDKKNNFGLDKLIELLNKLEQLNDDKLHNILTVLNKA